ncbi:MAG TPA: pyridoxamine 5'-phosphate oxidase family protein [Sphingomicrobium sp.]|jgi:nitroimidazol reductase NimA-like FMN-containing flavoprotein (pyridoxamine 5'-phosphate oxidase superfamily)
MEQPALRILNSHRLMAISTVRPDGWPQTTFVGYANRDFELFFMIFRASQKFSNISADDRVSIAVASEPTELSQLCAVYAAAKAEEITDPAERQEAWRLLMERHSNLSGFQMPDATDAVFMRARCRHLSVLDFSQGIGHREELTIDDAGVVVPVGSGKDRWGIAAADSGVSPS